MSRVKAGKITRTRHKKILKRARVTSEEEKTPSKWLIKQLKKQVNMLIETEK